MENGRRGLLLPARLLVKQAGLGGAAARTKGTPQREPLELHLIEKAYDANNSARFGRFLTQKWSD